MIERGLIPRLLKRARQPIYEEGPSWHKSKAGTPTMGGLAFVISMPLSLSLALTFLLYRGYEKTSVSILITLLFCIGNAIIGLVDDLTKLKRKENAGLTPRQKLLFQFLVAILFLMARKRFLNDTSIMEFAFGKIDLGILYYPASIIILLGIVNCANLTDGIDGLASSVAMTIGLIFLLIGNGNQELSIVSSSLLGGSVGFLLFNAYPAKIFMGDTGSLFFGAIAASLAFSYGNPLIIILIGGVYVIEGVSVILQVASYKILGRRIFKMAPIHHHLEKCGVSESRICYIAIATSLILSSVAILLFN
jgi:phospho-N-acetylmuramoyl-pentapeptide-transferase